MFFLCRFWLCISYIFSSYRNYKIFLVNFNLETFNSILSNIWLKTLELASKFFYLLYVTQISIFSSIKSRFNISQYPFLFYRIFSLLKFSFIKYPFFFYFHSFFSLFLFFYCCFYAIFN